MRKIYISLLKSDNKKYNKEYIAHILSRANSLITISPSEYDSENKLHEIIEKGKPIRASFYSKIYCTNENIEICFCEFDLESFLNNLDCFVDIVFEDAKKIINDPSFDDSKAAKSKISDFIVNISTKYLYKKPKNIVFLISDIFKGIITSHILNNCNKRFCAVLIENLLYQNGIFLKGHIKYKYKNFWEKNKNEFIKFITKYEEFSTLDNFNINNDNLLMEIYNWIYKSIYISLNFIN